MKRTEAIVLLLILATAIGFRFVHLGSVPPGLYPDEAMNGNNALAALRSGDFKIFYPENNGREGLFINLQAIAIHFLGNTPVALRSVSALIGVLTVLGVYLLARRMFDDWRLAAMAAFLMATGFWHVNFSRIGFRAILSACTAVWGFYYLYKGIETHRVWHWALAGLWFGLGFHTYIAFRVMPLAVILTLGAYWLSLRAAFSHDKYLHARHQMLGGVALAVGIMIIALLPMAAHFYANPGDLVGRTAKVSVWAGDNPWQTLAITTGKTLGMFFFAGDTNWRHNLAGQPILFWPVAALFAVGLLRTIWRFVHSWRTRGHPGVVHTLLLSWFFVGLLPAILSPEGAPHALRTILVAPAVYIVAGAGLHWLIIALERWYGANDHRQICLPMRHLPGTSGHRMCVDRSTFVVAVATVAFLIAVAIADGHRYFVEWGTNPAVASEFTAHYLPIAQRLNAAPPAALKYVVVTRGDVLVNGIPMSAQTVMYLTDTWQPAQQRERNIYYLTREQFARHAYPRGALVVQLDP
ncbi:MAG: glycosyltransferase family 39 protein [Candidatus Yanofskybacteria bacterium]|nr:glycosyltransferase family 39 protein [Candidatus Yanofskybacteria bacterium]